MPPANAIELARLLPGATVTVYPDSGHGAVFQYHREFDTARDFLRR
ncbi:alpha/beta fold hydrolase [Agromyces sp. Soil535]|nr:alpha/beta hydrolase [Agromyces sp. Soil535]